MGSTDSSSDRLPGSLELGEYRDWLRSCVVQVSRRYQAKFDASDIVQETLTEAHAKIDSFRGSTQAELAGWLRTMLTRNVLDSIRRLRARKRDVANEVRLRVMSTQSLRGRPQAQFSADTATPSRRLLNNEDLWRLREAIDRLPEAQRQAVALHHLEGLSLAEVAARIDRSTTAVAGLVHRGLRTLRRQLGD
ncbi:MAG: sigma-70 family RNA polymerase sigma factor [Pirellulaceae bacterium]|nr:sigma-70 family RNA polymerase sigma factor [Planctomycetales bacterium]